MTEDLLSEQSYLNPFLENHKSEYHPFTQKDITTQSNDDQVYGYNNKPCNNRGNKIRINISGRIFESYEKTLKSKEYSIFRQHCITKFFDNDHSEFYFDRDSKAFEGIFVYLQCGVLQKPESVPYKVFIEELQFFGFGKEAQKLYEGEITNLSSDDEVLLSSQTRIRQTLWNILENPEYNIGSRMLSLLSICFIFLSILIFLVETLPDIVAKERRILQNVELVCVTYFTIELTSRLLVSLNKLRFLMTWLNWVDFISILPFYINLVCLKQYSNDGRYSFTFLRALRLVRVFRVFKLHHFSRAIQLIIHTLISSTRELSLLLFFIVVITILFGSALYFFEHHEESSFQSIPHSFWFCIVTLTTVGYGDVVPSSLGGQLTASILSVTGILIIALPIPIIVNNFTQAFEKIMSDSPAYRFDFNPKLNNQINDEKEIKLPVQQLVTAL